MSILEKQLNYNGRIWEEGKTMRCHIWIVFIGRPIVFPFVEINYEYKSMFMCEQEWDSENTCCDFHATSESFNLMLATLEYFWWLWSIQSICEYSRKAVKLEWEDLRMREDHEVSHLDCIHRLTDCISICGNQLWIQKYVHEWTRMRFKGILKCD